MKQAIKKKKSIMFIYWIIPIVALIITGIMLKDKYKTKGKQITITLNNVNGLNIQKAPVMFNGIKVGNVDDIKIDENNLNRFKAYLVMYKKYDYLVKKGTKFWKVSPEISLSKGIKNLGTIITGSYIEILPPKPNKKELMKLPDEYHFIALDSPPLNGITTTIKSKNSSFGIGAILVYKGIQVGEIIDKELENNYIYYTALIYNKYRDVLASDTRFIPLKPLEFQASLKGIKLTIPSPKNLITGAIKIETAKKDNKPKKEYSFFIPKKIIKGYKFTIISDEKLPSSIFYKGFKIGELIDSQLKDKIYNQYIIYNKYQNLINNSTLFYKLNSIELKASLNKFSLQIPDIKSAVLGGVSFLTPIKENLTKKEFKIFDNKTALDEYLYEKDSEKITILSKKVIKKGTLITYKTLNAGKVVNCKYNPQKDIIEITAFIKKPFIKLINKTTKFYTNSGINIKAGLDGIKIQTPTLDSVINGSISFVTDKNKPDNTKIFKLLNYNDLSKNNYFTINLTMSKTNALKKGSIIEYNGFTLGKVQNLIFDKNITAIIKIGKNYKYLFGKNSKLYIQTFQAGLSGIKNPDSIIFGSKIVLLADKNDGFKSHFVIDSINPINSHYQKGLRVVLTAPSKAGLNPNSPVYYRKIKIGHIEKIKLSKTAQNVEIFVFIKPKYENIIRTNSKFFNTGVLAIKTNLLGIKIKTGTLESMIKGGIEVITPNNPGQKVTNGAIFKLYDKPKEKWFEYKPKLILNS
jgi:paraquat-inducible protein B